LSLMIVICVIATGGCAQHRTATSFAELEPRVKTGQTMYVTTWSGDVHKGTLERRSATSSRPDASNVAPAGLLSERSGRYGLGPTSFQMLTGCFGTCGSARSPNDS
jgi:hypothetical protein